MPQALVVGVPYDTFWHITPRTLSAFAKAHKLKQRLKDEQMWIMGAYVKVAVQSAVEQCLVGNRAKTKYLEEPIMAKHYETQSLTQEEKEKKEIQKMLIGEMQWQSVASSKNLPVTKFK